MLDERDTAESYIEDDDSQTIKRGHTLLQCSTVEVYAKGQDDVTSLEP
jgi:hypothetical protein